MSNLRGICAVVVLTLAFAISALAGTIDSPGAPAPAPTQTTSTSITTTVILTILGLIR